jgi:hypothetical protein
MSDGWYTERCGSYTRGPAHTFPVFRRSSIMSPSALGESQLWFYVRVCGVQTPVRSSFHSLIRELSQRAISAEKYLR